VIGGTIDGKYRVVRLLGRGGMGAVYEALDTRSGLRVAIKVMHPRSASDSDSDSGDNLGRFQREARAAAAINTDHVARVIDWGNDPARAAPYMVMEYLLGEDLHALLKRTGALRPEVALRILAQACLGVAAAHEARVIHRDIKPANLFLARTGGGEVLVKILDFGIAKIRPEREGGETTGLTRTGGMLGSPIYMSPEQARGIRGIDQRTDLWSLGVVLYRALTGHTPHDDTEALGDLIVAICSSFPRPVQEIAPWVPAEVAAVVHGALRIQPSERWQTATAMLDAIRPLLPHGWRLREEMLAPIDDASRAVIAVRAPDLLTTTSNGGRAAAIAGSVPPPAPLTPLPPVLHVTTGDTHVPASTATPSPSAARRSARQAWTMGAAGGLAVAVAGAGVYYGATAPARARASAAGLSSMTASAERALAIAPPASAEPAHVAPLEPAIDGGAAAEASARPRSPLPARAPITHGAHEGSHDGSSAPKPSGTKPLIPDRFE
jgi:eukaryotic-like serine/threonine-protein kinase